LEKVTSSNLPKPTSSSKWVDERDSLVLANIQLKAQNISTSKKEVLGTFNC